jgi:hypothetical protein
VTPRRLHKLLGFALLLPFLAWSLTGLFFLLRPAYDAAYASLEPRQYPLPASLELRPQPDWQEFRYLHTVLGPHLLVRSAGGWQQLDPATLEPRPAPDAASIRLLVEEALQADPQRYGSIIEGDARRLHTDTGVDIRVDWPSLSLSQSGRDTRWIDRLYNIHYLRWTGIAAVDQVLGVAGLLLLLLMTWTGTRLLLGPGRGRARTAAASASAASASLPAAASPAQPAARGLSDAATGQEP